MNTNVIFAVYKYLDESNSPMKFKDTFINVGNSMDAESGIFTCEVPGYYKFSFDGTRKPDRDGDIRVRLRKSKANGTITNFDALGDRNKNREWGTTSFSWIVNLDRSDTITLNAFFGTHEANYYALFSGHLIWSPET